MQTCTRCRYLQHGQSYSCEATWKASKEGSKDSCYKQYCLISDSTGTCRIVLWADWTGALKESESYHLQNVVLRQHKKYISVLEHDLELVPLEKLIRDWRRNHHRRTSCKCSGVRAVSKLLGMPLQGFTDWQCLWRCDTVVKLLKCSSSLVAKVKIKDDNGGSCHAMMPQCSQR